AAAAGRLAGPVTDASENAGKDVRVPIHHVGIGETALRDQADVFRNIGVSRAGPLAIHNSMVVVRICGISRFHSVPGHTPGPSGTIKGFVSMEARTGLSSAAKAQLR